MHFHAHDNEPSHIHMPMYIITHPIHNNTSHKHMGGDIEIHIHTYQNRLFTQFKHIYCLL